MGVAEVLGGRTISKASVNAGGGISAGTGGAATMGGIGVAVVGGTLGLALQAHGLLNISGGLGRLLSATTGSGGGSPAPSESKDLKYESNPKHEFDGTTRSGVKPGEEAAPMDLDNTTAEKLLNNSVESGNKRVGYLNGKFYEFQNHGGNKWHGYELEKIKNHHHNALAKLKKRGVISAKIETKWRTNRQ